MANKIPKDDSCSSEGGDGSAKWGQQWLVGLTVPSWKEDEETGKQQPENAQTWGGWQWAGQGWGGKGWSSTAWGGQEWQDENQTQVQQAFHGPQWPTEEQQGCEAQVEEEAGSPGGQPMSEVTEEGEGEVGPDQAEEEEAEPEEEEEEEDSSSPEEEPPKKDPPVRWPSPCPKRLVEVVRRWKPLEALPAPWSKKTEESQDCKLPKYLYVYILCSHFVYVAQYIGLQSFSTLHSHVLTPIWQDLEDWRSCMEDAESVHGREGPEEPSSSVGDGQQGSGQPSCGEGQQGPCQPSSSSGEGQPSSSSGVGQPSSSSGDGQEGPGGGQQARDPANPWHDLVYGEEATRSGQQGPSQARSGEYDWRAARADGYNQGGLQARARRAMLRMQQQFLNQQRLKWGLPVPPGTLQQQVRNERSQQLSDQMREAMTFRIGLEKAHAAAGATIDEMLQLGKAMQPNLPPWRANQPPVPPPPSGQHTYVPPPPPRPEAKAMPGMRVPPPPPPTTPYPEPATPMMEPSHPQAPIAFPKPYPPAGYDRQRIPDTTNTGPGGPLLHSQWPVQQQAPFPGCGCIVCRALEGQQGPGQQGGAFPGGQQGPGQQGQHEGAFPGGQQGPMQQGPMQQGPGQQGPGQQGPGQQGHGHQGP